MFATMRRKRRSTMMKNELGQSVDHFKRAAALAAQETSASVGPKLNAARDRVQPAAVKAKDTAVKAKDSASSGWDSALAALTPVIAAAGENVRQTGKTSKKVAKANQKTAQKQARLLQKRADKIAARRQSGNRTGKLFGLALLGAALGAGAAYAARRRKSAQWDEYEPSAPISPARHTGADDAAFEPADPIATTSVTGVESEPTTTVVTDTTDQTSSNQHGPTVSRMAGGKNTD